MPMTGLERKAAFLYAATLERKTLETAAQDACGVGWFHLSQGILGERPLGAETRQKFAAYIGRTEDDVFGDSSTSDAA